MEFAEQCVRLLSAFDRLFYRGSFPRFFVRRSEEARSRFFTVDPAPAYKAKRSTEELQAVLTDPQLSHFERYRAMFALRNIGDEAAVRVRFVSVSCFSFLTFV